MGVENQTLWTPSAVCTAPDHLHPSFVRCPGLSVQGSGKSNLMDAISFVLGVRTAQLRGSLRELLYSNSEGASLEDRPRRGYVKLAFETGDGDEVVFSRTIVPSSASAEASYTSQYRVDEADVGWTAYNARLQSYGILVQARNFLVFQARQPVRRDRTQPVK